MNKTLSEMPEYVQRLKASLADIPETLGRQFEVAIAPPSTHLFQLERLIQGSALQLAAQNCGTAKAGAFTGEISPGVLKELQVNWVIVGHSERRHIFKEEDLLIQSRMR